MQVPAAAFIEMASDAVTERLKDPHIVEMIQREVEEFKGFGDGRDGRLKQFRERLELAGIVGLTPARVGYLLGLETARVLLQTMPVAVQAGVEL